MPTSPTAVARAATRPSPAQRLRVAVLAAAALAVALGITLASAAVPAFAHDELIASSPEPGEVLGGQRVADDPVLRRFQFCRRLAGVSRHGG